MSSCLFECLKEAGLERYYSTLLKRGYDTAFSLLYLRPAELLDVGITTDSDRQRFLQLVQIIASFHQGGELSPRRASSPVRNIETDGHTGRTSLQSHDHRLLNETDVRGYQSTDSSTTSDSSIEYVPSPRRRAKSKSQSVKPTVKNIMPVPTADRRQTYEAHNQLNMNGDISRSYATGGLDSTRRQESTMRRKSSRFYPDDMEGNCHRNTSSKRKPRVNENLLPFPVHITVEEDMQGYVGNDRASVDVPLKVQRVVQDKGYNYGLPRDNKMGNDGNNVTPRTPNGDHLSGVRDPSSSTQNQRRITVCVRKRPLMEQERQGDGFDVVTCNREDGGRDGGLVVHELKRTVDMSEFVQQNVFQFDRVFAERATNKDVYDGAIKNMVDWVMMKNNRATCFGYGQTGAGKTHTLLGNHTEPGVFFHAAKDVLSRLQGQHTRSHQADKQGCTLSISLYEIYCSRIFDLLNDHKRLQALEDSNKRVHINGLKMVPVESMRSILQVVHQGLSARSIGVTGANQDSSRSHAIVQLTVLEPNDREFSRLSFIDLAGSERACDALKDSDKQNRLEGAEINQSLLALKECIRSLDLALAHTPFRQSKLTQVLRDSFIGNSKTCMIANISPCHTSLEHTMNTLRYASRVKELHRKPGMSSSTPRRKSRFVNKVKQSESRRPVTAETTPNQHRMRSPYTPSSLPSSHISRSISIDNSMKVMDYTKYTGGGRELSRTPPPTVTPMISKTTVTTQGATGPDNITTPKSSSPEFATVTNEMKSSGVKPQGGLSSLKINASIFTPNVVGCSSTPNKQPEVDEGITFSAHDTTISESPPTSTPRFLNDTEPVGGMPASAPCVREGTGKSLAEVQSGESSREMTRSKNRSLESITNNKTSHSNRDEHSSERESHTSSEHGSTKSNQRNCSSSFRTNSNESNNSNYANKSTSHSHMSGRKTEEDASKKDSHETADTKTAGSGVESAAIVPTIPATLPESRQNPGLPSPQKFLTYLKDKHTIKTKELKKQLREARRRQKIKNDEADGCEEESQSSDHSASSSSRSTNHASSSSCSTSRSNLTSNVRQHHQHLQSQSEEVATNSPTPSPVVVNNNIPTPPRLPSPKLDQSMPRRSSRTLHGSSPRSASPGTGGRNTPESSSASSPATATAVASASELHARLACAANANATGDNDCKVSTTSEKPLRTSTLHKPFVARDPFANAYSSSDKENSKHYSKHDEDVQRAQSEVVIAHQEHISEILRISIEEERLYHELREQWGKGASFEIYTRSLQKLLARKTQSIEALKVQLALYDRVRNAPE